MKTVVTRFPPSPTGNLHIGGARTALFNLLFARHCNGKVYLRLENTDEDRSKREYEENILSALGWLGLFFDPLPDGSPLWRQSDRKDVYRAHLKKLIDDGRAYRSAETEGDRREVIRFKNPNTTVAFDDHIRGRIEFDTAELGDFVIARSENEPLYHLAVVVDDCEMGVTHVIRGEDHISNTPRQILLGEALGFSRPEYAHIPLILAPDRSKLSKRHGAVAVTEYRDKGYLPEAICNYLALLGWNPGTEREIFTFDELVKEFDLSKVQKSGAIFSEEKLRWMNRQHLLRLPEKTRTEGIVRELAAAGMGAMPPERKVTVARLLLERIHTFGDVKTLADAGELSYFAAPPELQPDLLLWKKDPDRPRTRKRLLALRDILAGAEKSFTKEKIESLLAPLTAREGKGEILWPMRAALSGKEKSPDPFSLAEALGKEETLSRIKAAADLLS